MGDQHQHTQPDSKRRRLNADIHPATKRLRRGSGRLLKFQTEAGYTPKTMQTSQVIAQLQQFVGEVLGVSDYDTVKLTTEEVLAILKDSELPDDAKEATIQEILGHVLAGNGFHTLLTLSAGITDYAVCPHLQADDSDMDTGDEDGNVPVRSPPTPAPAAIQEEILSLPITATTADTRTHSQRAKPVLSWQERQAEAGEVGGRAMGGLQKPPAHRRHELWLPPQPPPFTTRPSDPLNTVAGFRPFPPLSSRAC